MSANLPIWIERQLQEVLKQRTHAWLIQGSVGMGQLQLAYELAAACLCETGCTASCGECASCKTLASRTNADLLILMPEVRLLEQNFPLSVEAQQELSGKKRKPSKEIKIGAMREAINFSQQTSSRGKGKIVIIYPAERMNTVAANALLKTLEEPAGNTKFILVTEAGHKLLPTIRSRCLVHQMQIPSYTEALEWLCGTFGLNDPEAQVLLAASGGNPQEAVDMVAHGVQAKTWQYLPQAAIRSEISVFADFTPYQIVSILQKLCHDLLCQKANTSPRFFSLEALPKVSVGTWESLTTWSKQLRQAAQVAEHPYNADLFVEHLLAQCASACRFLAKNHA